MDRSVSILRLIQIFEITMDLMKKAGRLSEMKGQQKKEFVLNEIAQIIPLNNELEDAILFLIDKLIDVQNGNLVFNPKPIKQKIFNICC